NRPPTRPSRCNLLSLPLKPPGHHWPISSQNNRNEICGERSTLIDFRIVIPSPLGAIPPEHPRIFCPRHERGLSFYRLIRNLMVTYLSSVGDCGLAIAELEVVYLATKPGGFHHGHRLQRIRIP